MRGATLYALLIVGSMLLETLSLYIWKLVTGTQIRSDHFRFGRYLWFILFPLAVTLLFFYLYGENLWAIFLWGCLVGGILEFLVGWSYRLVVGQRLWTYHRFDLGGYTSFLSMPIWGMAAVLFSLLGVK